MSAGTDEPAPTGRRVRVVNPLVEASSRSPRSVRQEIDESTTIGELYVRSLVRSQLRAALTVVATVLLLVASLPLVFVLVDDVTTARLLGVPLPWLLLGVAVYPVLIVVAWLYVRQAERAEQDFAGLVEQHDQEL
ncbi:hypothetical protein ASD11_13890 [Aeromicrobium sp. Root495]|uniref:hypothetical protein n=1 Tax=Aeromicrobium sp. Root495 TaxID=1736550 RepID=UPI0006FAE847|nr:hypothetical protein [Aeromicrobium sp. Root495]KQY60529.1 hypothetical protein ASD11_13890 [Aeromicrobium sp. Root495]